MKKLSFLLAFAVTATTTVAVLAGDDPDSATLAQIYSYRQWRRVNAKPVEVPVPTTLVTGTIGPLDGSSIAL